MHTDIHRVLWRLRDPQPTQIELALPNNAIRLEVLADTGGGIEVLIEAELSFALEIETEFVSYLEHVPAGRTRYLLTHLDRTDIRRL